MSCLCNILIHSFVLLEKPNETNFIGAILLFTAVYFSQNQLQVINAKNQKRCTMLPYIVMMICLEKLMQMEINFQNQM